MGLFDKVKQFANSNNNNNDSGNNNQGDYVTKADCNEGVVAELIERFIYNEI